MSLRKSSMNSISGQKMMEASSDLRMSTPHKQFPSPRKSPSQVVDSSTNRSPFVIVLPETQNRPTTSARKDSSWPNDKYPGRLSVLTLAEMQYRPATIHEDFQKQARDLVLFIRMLILMIDAIQIASIAAAAVTIILLLWSLIDISIGKSVFRTLFGCKLKDITGCFTSTIRAFFPLHKIIQSPRIFIRISSSGLANSSAIYELGFPLSYENPFILIVVLLFTSSFTLTARCLRALLKNIEATVSKLTTTRL
jgi:hypothetical protein